MSDTTTTETFRVVYLGAHARRAYHETHETHGCSRVDAEWILRSYKRQGRTAWIETSGGTFVPVKGASRKPTEAT
jgi:hypothetical protein